MSQPFFNSSRRAAASPPEKQALPASPFSQQSLPPLLHPDAGLRRVLAECAPLGIESVKLHAACGRILAEPVVSSEALPPFKNSSMDGYALAAAGAPVPAGSEFLICGELAAGDAPLGAEGAAACGLRPVTSNGVADNSVAWEIMTGAPLPAAADRVVAVENTERLENPPRVRVLQDVLPGQSVRCAGTDVKIGERLIKQEQLFVARNRCPITAQHIMLLAAIGQQRLRVAERPRLALLCTGRELVDAAMKTLEPGQIRNASGPFLAARIERAGGVLAHQETVGDDVAVFLAAFERARKAGAHIILSSGAVSMGRYDFVPEALRRLGAKVIFHKLAIRPGKPLLFARLPDGTLYFGLPGNPISTAVGMRFFVEPAMRAQLGLPPEKPWRVPLLEPFSQGAALRFHLKSRVTINACGQLGVRILPGQQSYRIRPLADANCWAVTTLEAGVHAAGTLVDVYGPGHLETAFANGG